MEREKERKREGNVLAIYPDQESDPVSLGSPFQSVPGRRWVQRPYRSPFSLSLSVSLLRSTPLHLLHLRGPCISRRQRGHFYPPRSLPPAPLPFSFRRLPSPLGTPSSQPAFPSPASSLITLGGLNAFITRPFSLQTFGIGAEGGGPESASGGWKFEKEESGDRVGRREKGRWIGVTGCVGATG